MGKHDDEDGDVECPDCGKGMKFLKRKGDGYGYTHKTYSVWGCKKCHRKHTIYDDGDCDEVDWDWEDE